MRNNIKNIQKGITAILFAVVIVASVFLGMSAVTAQVEVNYVELVELTSIAPRVNAGSDITVEQATAAGTEVTLSATVSDLYSVISDSSPTVIWSHGPTAVFPLGGTTVTVTATNALGNSASDTVFVNVEDTMPPVITCPADVTAEQESTAGTAVPLTATATDTCDADVSITSDELAIYPLGTTTVTFTATDDSGNSASCSMTVTVEDTTAPVITCPADVTVEQATAAGTVVPLTATDICDASPTITSDELAIYPLGTTTVTFTATDNAGNSASCSMTVTVEDTTPPVITCPADVTVEQATAAGTVVPLTTTATDICDASPTITSDELAIYPLGTTTVTFTATDDSGNSASCSMTVTVEDTTPPVITCPADVTVEQATAAGTVVPLTTTATDICDASPTITSDELAIYPLGTTTVTFTATDDSGNSASCSMTVTIEDTTPPVITCPADVTVEQATAAGTVVPLTTTATDICDASPTITSDELAIYPLGTTTVTFTATDDSGNSASCSMTVTVEDTTPPVITCPADVTVEQATAAGTVVPLTTTATDICDADPMITSSGELAFYPLGSTTVTFTAEDDSGNTASCTTTVTVEDTTPPELIIQDDVITVEQETREGTVVSLTQPTAIDISDASPTITSDKLVIYALGTTTVTFTAIDVSGNSVSKSMVVHVIDTTPPEISVTVSPDTLWPPNHKMVDIVATVPVSDISDHAPSVVLTSVTSNEPDNDKGNGDGNTINDIQGADISTEDYEFPLRAERAGKGDGRVYTITYTVTDKSGNSASASATVVVPLDMG